MFAAASLQRPIDEAIASFEERNATVRIVASYASSGSLARQAMAAPVADVFVSADASWCRRLEDEGLVEGTCLPLFGNRLALVSRQDSPYAVSSIEELCLEDFARLVIGEPEAAPVGRYAREWLAGEWSCLEPRLAAVPHALAVTQLVLASPDHLGVVYRTEAMDRLRIILEGPEVTYYGAVLKGRPFEKDARRFLEFLAASAIPAKHGFQSLP